METVKKYQELGIREMVDALKQHLKERGYRPSSLKTYGCILNRFAEFCAERGEEKYTIQLGRDFVWEKCGSILGENDRSKNVNRAMHMMTDFQRHGMIFLQHNVRLEGFSDEYAPLFDSYLASVIRRGIAKSSVRKYRNFLFRFEGFLKDRGVERFNQLELHHVNAYVETFAGLAQNTVSAAISDLRQLMDFAKEKGYHHTSFAPALPIVRYRQTKRLPAVFSANEVERIVANIDRSNPKGKRNYAIILTAAKLGLRVSDVLGLTFDSFDWDRKTISICQKKTGVPLDLHIPEDVGWGIIEYLKHGRPESLSRNIFIAHHAPYDAMTANFGKEIARAVQKAGIKVPADKVIGMHTFRHSLATSMLDNGATISEIAQILGHARVETSEDYISLSTDLLRECALEVSF
jgi:site-specific recombinase XerD